MSNILTILVILVLGAGVLASVKDDIECRELRKQIEKEHVSRP